MGSSIIKKAWQHSRKRKGGPNLGFDFMDVDILWQGYSGLTLDQFTDKLITLSQIFEEPDVLIIHCGGNSIGDPDLPSLEFRKLIKRIFAFVRGNFPDTKIVWSQILPRGKWKYCDNLSIMNETRQRLNNYAATECIRQGGYYIKYPNMKLGKEYLWDKDKVHLTDFGNEELLGTLRSALAAFLWTQDWVYPQSY